MPSPAEWSSSKALRWLYSAVPEDDLKAAIQNQDFRFLSINGVGLIVPGVYIQCLDRDKQINPIKGTSDVLETREHEKLNQVAIKYAKSCNTKLLKHIIAAQDFGCEN